MDTTLSTDERLRLLKISVDRSSDEIFWLDFEGNILYVNDAACRITGYSREEFSGMTIADLDTGIPPGAWETSVADLRERKTQFITSRHQCKNGEFIDVEILAVYVNQGEHEFSFAFVRDITDRKRTEKALDQAKKKLTLLNYVTINDLQNLTLALSGYQNMVKITVIDTDHEVRSLLEKEEEILQKISDSLKFAQNFQDLGLKPAKWQNVSHAFLMAISHLDFSRINHSVTSGGLEIFADPLLEQVFQILADNTLTHSISGTRVTVDYKKGPGKSLTVVYEDNGVGIAMDAKERVFLPEFQVKKSVGLFLAREILEITDIAIHETGEPGKGARFEMTVPKGAYRFSETVG